MGAENRPVAIWVMSTAGVLSNTRRHDHKFTSSVPHGGAECRLR
jgi:hypothetical protein